MIWFPRAALIVIQKCRHTRRERANAVKLSRHLGRDCRDPGYKDVLKLTILGSWIPAIPTEMTGDVYNGEERAAREREITRSK